MEGSLSNSLSNKNEMPLPKEDEIQVVNNEEIMAEDDDERCQLLLNISLDKIDNHSGESLNSETSSSSSIYQMTTFEKFNYIATRILYSKYFQYYYLFIIILSGISIVLSYVFDCTNGYILTLEALIILALILEVTILLLAQRKYFFYSIWNILDVVIIAVCAWLFFITEANCPSNDIIDNSILIVRYIIQFIRLGLLLKKNKSSGGNKKRISVNFNHLRKKPTYGSFEPSSSTSNRKGKRTNLKDNEGKVEDGEEGEGESYHNISNIIDSNIFNPYRNRFDSIDDPQNGNLYGSIPNDSFLSPGNQSFAQEYAPYLHESNGSIDFNIDSNANLVKMFFREEGSGEFDNKKNRVNSIHTVNNDVYQKLIHNNIENNNRNLYGIPNTTGMTGEQRFPSSSTQPGRGQSNDSLSTNPIETPSSSVMSPSSYRIKKPIPTPQPQTQKSFSSSLQTDNSFTITLPPKVGRKPNNRIAHTNHSSTFSEVPNKINLLTPILYGSPATFTRQKNANDI